MSARRRSGRGKGAAGNNNGGGSPSGGVPKGGGQGGGGGKAKAKKVVDFWEVPGAVPADLAAAVLVPDDPTVLVRSLGAPVLPGQGANAEHYFTAVYEKASHVAYALAVANGLLADEDDPSTATSGSSDGGDSFDASSDDASPGLEETVDGEVAPTAQ